MDNNKIELTNKDKIIHIKTRADYEAYKEKLTNTTNKEDNE